MEDTHSVATLIDSTTSKIQQLQKAFAELESHRAVTLNLKWKELEAHFHGLEKSLKRRFHELEDQEKEYEIKTMKAREILVKREAAVMAKEEASLERLQEKRDAAVFAVSNAKEKHMKIPSMDDHDDVTEEGLDEEPSVEDKPPDSTPVEFHIEDLKDSSEDVIISRVKSYPELVKLCKEMDSTGLHKFISDNRKNLATIREEIPFALRAASNPARLVLDSLEDFYNGEEANLDSKKDSNLLGLRRTCIMLMECLSVLLSNMDPVSVSDVISEDMKKQAKEIAEEWKPRLEALDVDASNGNSLEAHAFLQLLATFGIVSDFDEEELFRLVPMVSRRRQTADLCRSLGLSSKMPGVIEVLVNSGRPIDAVNLSSAFGLIEQFPPVPLLKSYLKEAKKSSSPFKPGNTSPPAQNDFNERELSALKAVIKCVEEHKLEEQYPLDPLQKRLFQLEKAKADKKRVTEPARPQPKRPRASGYGPLGARFASPMNVAEKNTIIYPHPRVTERYAPAHYSYVYPAGPGGPTDPAHCPTFMGSPGAYNISPAHGNYFGYHHQPAPYLH